MKQSRQRSKRYAKQTSLLGPLSKTLNQIAQREGGYPVDRLLHSLLSAARSRLSMEVAFISQFTDGRRMFRYVNAKSGLNIIRAGEGGPLDESYCLRVVQGLLPELIHDAQSNPEAMLLDATRLVPVGAHVSVPIRMADGTVYGTFCAFSRTKNAKLDARDLAFLRVLADISAVYLEHQLQTHASEQHERELLQRILDEQLIHTLFQPIVRLRDGRAVGFEALTRTRSVNVPPDRLFELAVAYDMIGAVTQQAFNCAMRHGSLLPRNAYISINAGPEEVLSGLIEKLLRRQKDPSRYVLEITEHAIVNDYEPMLSSLKRLRQRGIRIAVDDAGAGYASFRHILCLKPDIIKLDISLVRDIHNDKDKQDLVAALRDFSVRRGTALVAEGVETEAELKQLLDQGIEHVQGYLLSRPVDAKALTDTSFNSYPIRPGDAGRSGQSRARRS